MSTALETIGFMVTLFGASAMDSPSVAIPVIITAVGAVTMYIGLRFERRGF